ncbi:MAG: hypothetical protein IKJ36_04355 [Clostridia bacterium]|nr:hypothetical protein [Clostridia bacterium]
MEMNRKLEKFQELLKLQEKVRKGLVNKEDLTYKEKIMLCRLYDVQMNEKEDENKRLLDKVVEYKKKIS